jgi:hypothetical protein
MTNLLNNIPAWLYILFFGLIYYGYTQSKTRKVSRIRITVLPVILLSLSLYGVLHVANSMIFAILTWLAGIALAFLINSKIRHGQGVILHQDNQHYVVPGSWIPLVLLMSAFIAKFSLGYLSGSHMVDPANSGFILISSGISGLISGTFGARAMQIFKAGATNPSTLVSSTTIGVA